MRWDSGIFSRGGRGKPRVVTGFFFRSTDGIVCLLAHGPFTTVTCVPTSLYCDLALRQLNVEGCQSPRRGLGKCCCGITAVWDKLSLYDRAFGESFALRKLGDSLLFPVRRQNMCLVGTLTIRGPSFFAIVLRFSQGLRVSWVTPGLN